MSNSDKAAILFSIIMFIIGIFIGVIMSTNNGRNEIYEESKRVVKECELEIPRKYNCDLIIQAVPVQE